MAVRHYDVAIALGEVSKIFRHVKCRVSGVEAGDMTRVSLHRVLVSAWASASRWPIILVYLHSGRVHCGPLSVQLSLWNCLYLRDLPLLAAVIMSLQLPASRHVASHLIRCTLGMAWTLASRLRELRKTSELEGAPDLAEWLTESSDPGWVGRGDTGSGGILGI